MAAKSKPSIAVNPQFQRSIRIDVDFDRFDALKSYVCQPGPAQALDIVAHQVLESQQRAFTWTGPYGGGKSSLALALAQLAGGTSRARTAAREALRLKSGSVSSLFDSKRPWLALPVVGNRAPIEEVIAEVLDERSPKRGPKSRKNGRRDVIAELVRRAESHEYSGVLLILDEFGKFLEGTIARGEDVYFFQELAEAASRCHGKLVVIGVLHQSFDQYAARLGRDTRNEWAKVQGRFVDVPLVSGVDEVIQLIGNAITCQAAHPGSAAVSEVIARSIHERRPTSPSSLSKQLDRCWPLHPVTAALLGPSSRRKFGQNERSVFGFLGSAEPFGFQSFLQQFDGRGTYRPAQYWDYLRANFEPAILSSPDGHRWALVADAVERAEARYGALHVELIKCAGLIELFRNGSGVAGSAEVLSACVGTANLRTIEAALEELGKASMLVYRKHLQAWCVFAGSDFDIEAALTSARQVTGAAIEAQLRSLAVLPPLTARRHYSETGTLRWFDREVMLAESAARGLVEPAANGRAGRFVLLLPTRECAADEAHKLAKLLSKQHAEFLTVVGVPSGSLGLAELASELAALSYVTENHRPLHGDAIARREVEARTQQVRMDLEEALREGFNHARWYVNGHAKDVKASVGLSPIASEICDQVFDCAPVVHSELINRDMLSSQAAKAQRFLMHRMMEFGHVPKLGYEGYPADAGLYYTTISALGLHRVSKGVGAFVSPVSGRSERDCRVAKLWDAFYQALSGNQDGLTLGALYEVARRAPFGIKKGLIPVLVLAFFLAHRREMGVYIEGVFVPDVTTSIIDEWLQDPTRVSFKWVPMDLGARRLLTKLADKLAGHTNREVASDPLDSARALVSIALRLPAWTQRTRHLTDKAREVRSALLRATDPIKVIYVDLPEVLGVGREPETLVDTLGDVITELESAYPQMLRRIEANLLAAIDHAGEMSLLRDRANQIKGASGDFRLDAFASRLAAYQATHEELEGLISLATSKPPKDFNDHDVEAALVQLAKWSLEFRRIEALTSMVGGHGSRRALAVVFGGRDTVSGVFDVAERDLDAIQQLAGEIVSRAKSEGIKSDVLLAALAEAGAQLLSNQTTEAA